MDNNIDLFENQISEKVKNLNSEFRLWTIALVVLGVISFWLGPKVPNFDNETAISIQSMLLLLLMIGLPGIFMWFRNRMQTLKDVENIEIRLNRYETYSRLRQALFFLFGLLVLIVRVFTLLKGGFMLFMVVIVLGIFIVPSRSRLIMEANLHSSETK